MKKFVILIPAFLVAGIALMIPKRQDPQSPVPEMVLLHPDTQSGGDTTLEFHGGPHTDAYDGQPTSGSWHGRFRYQQELGGLYLYLYDSNGHLVNRVHNPEWVKAVKNPR